MNTISIHKDSYRKLICWDHHKIFFDINELYSFKISCQIFKVSCNRYRHTIISRILEKNRLVPLPLRYVHLKCIIIIFNNEYNACKCWDISFNKRQDLYFPEHSEKLRLQRPLGSFARKNISMAFFKVNILHSKFCMISFHRIRDKTITRILEKRNSSVSYYTQCSSMYTQTASLLFLIIYILYINFCANSSTRSRDQFVPKIPEKV